MPNSTNIIKELEAKQKQLQELQKQEDRRRGREDELLRQLINNFGVQDLEAAKDCLEKMQIEITEDERKLENLKDEMDNIITKATVKVDETKAS